MIVNWTRAMQRADAHAAQAAALQRLCEQCAALTAENVAMRAQVAALQAELAAMQTALCGMTESYAFYYEQYCAKCREVR